MVLARNADTVVGELPHCCRAAACAGQRRYTFDNVRPTVAEFLALGRTSAEQPAEPAPAALDRSSQRWRDSVHEAGHLTVGHEVGFMLAGATLDPPTAYIFQFDDSDVVDRIAMMLAGQISERWVIERHIFHQFDGFWRFFINAVRAKKSGTCDECRAVAAALTACPDANDEAIITTLREGEDRAIAILTDGVNSEITTALADRLCRETRLNAAALYAAIREMKGTTWR